MVVVSSCLAGNNCRYDGKNNLNEEIKKLVEENKAICICPEQLGKMTTPRPASEIKGNKVVNNIGEDVTYNFNLGAIKALEICKKYNIRKAILKAKSPSCGCGKIYDGTFTKTLIDGDGITTRLFKQNRITVITENEIKNEPI